MTRTAFSLLLLAVFGSFAQQTNEASFVGTWEAKIKDRVFVVLKIAYDGKLIGTMSGVSVSTDDDGNVTDAEPAGKDSPIHDLKVEGDRLTFVEPKPSDSDVEPDQCEMKLTGEGVADFRLLDDPDVKLKPHQLRQAQAAEQGFAGEHEMLLHGIVDEEVRDAFGSSLAP